MPIVDHGARWRGLPTPMQSVVEALSALNVVVGAFPTHLASRPAEANDVIMATSYAEAVELFGFTFRWDKFPCCEAMYSSFADFGTGPVVFINTLDRNKASHRTIKSNIELSIVAMSDGQIEPAKLPDNFVLRDTVKLQNAAGTTTYEPDVDYTLSIDEDERVLVTPIVGGGIVQESYVGTVQLKAGYTCLNPDGMTGLDIIGGIDLNTGEEKGLELIAEINAKYGDPYVPGILLAPGFAHDVNVKAVLRAKTERIDGMYGCIALLDIDSGETGAKWYQEALALKKKEGVDGENTISLYPKVVVGDREMHFSSRLGAAMAYLDSEMGMGSPRETPSSKDIRISGTCLAGGKRVNIRQEQAEVLNINGIVTAIRTQGYVAYGNYTSAVSRTNDPALYQITLRRMINWIGNTCVMTIRSRVDNLQRLELVTEALALLNGWISGLVGLRSVAPGTQALFRAQDNPDTDLANGKLRIYIDYGGYIPAQLIEILIGYNPQHMLNELKGGMSNG